MDDDDGVNDAGDAHDIRKRDMLGVIGEVERRAFERSKNREKRSRNARDMNR